MADGISNLSPEAGVAIGIVVGLLSTCVQSIGLTLQRKSHMLEDEKLHTTAHHTHRPAYRRRRWQVGMLLFLIANIVGSTIQITTLPLPLLSTLQASGLVFNSLLATLLLKEPWTWKTICGTILVAGGAVLISFYSAVPEPSHNLAQLLDLLQKRTFLVWFILSLVFVVAVLIADFVMRKCVPERRKDIARFHLVRGMSYGMISGILSAHALLLAKSAVELIVRSLADHQNQFSTYQPWLLVVAFVILALSQLYYLHLGLRLISTSILYPFVFCIYNIVAILDGLIYFRHMDDLPPLHAGLIAVGTVILLAGVLALSWRIRDDDEGEASQMVTAEIPQTLLVPGSGFVADPEDDDTNISASVSDYESDDQESLGERAALLTKKTRPRSRTSSSRPVSGHFSHHQTTKRRKRAHTLRDVSEIWNQLGSSVEEDGSLKPAYGSFVPRETDVAQRHSDDISARPSSAHFLPLAAAADDDPRTESAVDQVNDDDPDGESDSRPSALQRAKTMPNPRRSKSRRRRKSGHHEGGALFSDMLRREWWRTRRRGGEDESGDDEHDDGDDDGEGDYDDEEERQQRQDSSSRPDGHGTNERSGR